ncbi:MAG: class I SAM-dependent methyltransferase [Phycisphaerales bacterium]|nr:class I SAM-dependent methyltransferase [Planctomycetota bacterium]MCH8508235.1 class I SAM-dependent methyltransferase [Phycisphaerales bacterium]
MAKPEPIPPAAPAHEAAERRDWVAYFDRMEGKPPRPTLIRAMDRFGPLELSDAAQPPLAIDLGCGSGQDLVPLLERGWRVWASDAHPEGLARLRARPACAAAIADGRLTVVQADFETVEIPPARLVNASFALPFCPPVHFPALWARIDAAVPPGGRFSGQFFGDRDDWAILEDRTHLTRAETLALFDQYILEHFEEEDRPSTHAGEHHKHWHVFHIVARKR